MKWNKKTIEQAEKELSELENLLPGKDAEEAIKDFFSKYGIYQIKLNGQTPAEWVRQIFEHAHTFLQTKMMLNACNYSKLACMWAAIAAIVAALGILASWYVFLLKMIF